MPEQLRLRSPACFSQSHSPQDVSDIARYARYIPSRPSLLLQVSFGFLENQEAEVRSEQIPFSGGRSRCSMVAHLLRSQCKIYYILVPASSRAFELVELVGPSKLECSWI